MDILGFRSDGHAGALCYVQEGRLVFNAAVDRNSMSDVVQSWQCTPHVLCGQSRTFGAEDTEHHLGIDADSVFTGSVSSGGGQAPYLSVSRELAHIACGFALSGLPPGQPFHALVWDGGIGNFYHVDGGFRVTRLGGAASVVDRVGERYCLPLQVTGRVEAPEDAARKIMALTGFAPPDCLQSPPLKELSDYLLEARLSRDGPRTTPGDDERLQLRFGHLRSVAETDSDFAALCRALHENIFERFRRCAEQHVLHRLPLVIAGGCGANSEWNSAWRASPLFDSVFVPPVPGANGIAIGAAAVAQHRGTGRMDLAWDPYAGEEFVHEPVDFEAQGYYELPFNLATLCEWLVRYEMVVAWVQGRYEIGTKSLCHRALLAAPFAKAARDRLNRILRRAAYIPVDAVCLESEVDKHFEWVGASPHGLYSQRLRSRELHAVTHVDRTARVLTMTRAQDRRTTELLETFRAVTGFGVLCNAALRMQGRAFINRTSELLRFATENEIHALVIDGRMYLSATMQDRLLNCESPVHGI